MDVVNYMHQNFRAAKRPPEDPVGGTIRDLSEHYEKCLEEGKREPRSFVLPLFPPGDPRNNPPVAEPGVTSVHVIICNKPEAA